MDNKKHELNIAKPEAGATSVGKPPVDLLPGVPADFTRFIMPSHPEVAQIFNRYTWYFWTNRLYNNNVMFYKEYMTLADMWLNHAIDPRRRISIQQCHRDDLQTTLLHSSGYVASQQHYSHADDWGWVFPVWTQSQMFIPGDPTCRFAKGTTFGWHFQTSIPPYWIDGGFLNGFVGLKEECMGEGAVRRWELQDVVSHGIVDEKWHITASGPNPVITSPDDVVLNAFECPYIQLRWLRDIPSKTKPKAVIEWMRKDDHAFAPERSIEFYAEGDTAPVDIAAEYVTGDTIKGADNTWHSIIPMHKHPLWNGKIKRFRIRLAPVCSQASFQIDSIFTAYDTRHTINNPLFVMGSWNYYRWSGDTAFLKKQICRMRMACNYQMEQLGGLERSHIRNTWPGHDGLPGWQIDNKKPGKRVIHGGHGIGNNYYDILPFGWDDMYATSQYYGMLKTMAKIEQLIEKHPEWGMPSAYRKYSPSFLNGHAAKVKQTANKLFWNARNRRFIGSISKDGVKHDYGFTFVNQEAIWYDIATDEHAQQIMDWITGKRVVDGDTSQAADIYRFEFGPRATTKRNVEWYGQGWYYPEGIPFGGQIQDGGAVLGFAFYDLWSRLRVYGADSAWQQFTRIAEYEKKVVAAGGYRNFYSHGDKGTTMQGGGQPGGIGVDNEFLESALLPAFIITGFLGINPDGDNLVISPNLPKACPSLGVRDMQYRGCRWNILADEKQIIVELLDRPSQPLKILWHQSGKLRSKTIKAAATLVLPK